VARLELHPLQQFAGFPLEVGPLENQAAGARQAGGEPITQTL
jgi:hypothetical protein